MPSRPAPSGGRTPRRRPSPASSGGWIWLVLLATVIAMVFFIDFGAPTMDNSDFYKLLDDNQISEVLVTPDRITGEVKDPEKVLEKYPYLKDKLRSGKKFVVRRQGTEDKGQLEQELRKHDGKTLPEVRW